MRTIFTQLLAAAAFTVGLALGFQAVPAAAAEGSHMTLSPTKQRIDIEAGGTYEGTFSIYNTGKDELKFRVYAAPYTVRSDVDYTPVFSEDKPRTQISRWVSFEQTEFTVAPDEKVEVTYNVAVPISIPAGSQYAALFAETIAEGDGAVAAKKRLGMLLYAKPDGQTDERGSATFDQPNFWQMSGKVATTTHIKNEGNTDFEAKVNLRVMSLLGSHEAYATKTTKLILPESRRAVTLEWPQTPPIGVYKVSQTASIAGEQSSVEKTIIVISPIVLIVIISILAVITAWGVRRVTRKSPSLTKR